MRKLAAAAILSLLGCPASADVSVSIVDYPREVLSYSPIFVTAEIRNDGKDAILVPASNFTANRYLIEIGSDLQSLSELRPFETSGGGAVVWLKPGGRWLLRQDLGLWVTKAGPVFVRIGVQSGGECEYYANGHEDFPLRGLEKRPGVETYACWKGRAQSDPIRIDVAEPQDATDRAALEFARSPGFPGTGDLDNKFTLRLRSGFRALLDRFPTSHYTYVGGFYACERSSTCLQQLIDAQPSNALTAYTKLQQSLAVLDEGRAETLTPAAISALHLPDPLSEYLVQEKARMARRASGVKAAKGEVAGAR